MLFSLLFYTVMYLREEAWQIQLVDLFPLLRTLWIELIQLSLHLKQLLLVCELAV